MELGEFFKSVLEQDKSAIVICNINHKIVYMNPIARERYKKYGGEKLIGKSLLDCHNEKSGEMIIKVLGWFKADISHNIVHTYYNIKENKDVYMIALRDDGGKLIGYYEKHEYRNIDTEPFYNLK